MMRPVKLPVLNWLPACEPSLGIQTRKRFLAVVQLNATTAVTLRWAGKIPHPWPGENPPPDRGVIKGKPPFLHLRLDFSAAPP